MDRLKIVLRRFYYLCLIAGKTLNGIKQTCFNVIAAIKNKESIEGIEKIINEKLKKDNITGIALEKLNGEVYFENWIKPVLLLVEYKQNDSDDVNFIKVDSKLQLEHIFPKNFLNAKVYILAKKKVINI